MEIVIGGLGVLFGLAVLVGRALDREAQESAWRRIATSRRINAEKARELEAYELSIDVTADELAVRERRLDLREERQLLREELFREEVQRHEMPRAGGEPRDPRTVLSPSAAQEPA